ncbi:MAG: hypothetical protein AB7K37_01810 [Cyclobacteriaceae bacterium]
MIKGLGFVLLLVGLFQCEGNKKQPCESSACAVTATVVDLTGLDGCGLVFELEDGSRKIPEYRTYVQPPKPEEDPLYYFDLKAGQRVRISYEESLALSACMAGSIIFVTCITDCTPRVD